MIKTLKRFIVAGALLAASAAAHAAVYTISWTGSGGYSMTGSMSFSDALLGTGPITASSLTSFSIEGFLGAASVGTWDRFADGLGVGFNFNFNFDTTTEQFLTGGFSASSTGQDWNTTTGGSTCNTFGFSSGSASQGLCINGSSFVGAIPISQPTLIATRVSSVPEPSALALLGVALAGFAFARRARAS
jgi:hypothetical protein